MRESRAKKAERVTTVLRLLKETYPDAKPELDFNSPFELLIATMLSAQCTDKQVNKTTAVLFPKYGTPEAFAALTEDELAPYIKGCGLYKTKGKNIIAASRILLAEYGGEVPNDRDALTKLPGVGRPTSLFPMLLVRLRLRWIRTCSAWRTALVLRMQRMCCTRRNSSCRTFRRRNGPSHITG